MIKKNKWRKFDNVGDSGENCPLYPVSKVSKNYVSFSSGGLFMSTWHILRVYISKPADFLHLLVLGK